MNMTPEQALANLDGAVAVMQVNRETTLGLMTSVKVLQGALVELAALTVLKAKGDDENQRS